MHGLSLRSQAHFFANATVTFDAADRGSVSTNVLLCVWTVKQKKTRSRVKIVLLLVRVDEETGAGGCGNLIDCLDS